MPGSTLKLFTGDAPDSELLRHALIVFLSASICVYPRLRSCSSDIVSAKEAGR